MMDTLNTQNKSLPEGLRALLSRAEVTEKKHPPVELWDPPFCGDLDIRIARDGSWFYLRSPIRRLPLVKLFASVLRKDDDGRHYLVTPVEKIGIQVEDAPFLAVEMFSEGEGQSRQISVRTNLGDLIKIGSDHPIFFKGDPDTMGFKPYVRVRGRLDALFTRSLTLDLAEYFQEGSDIDSEAMGIWSGGRFFEIDAQLFDTKSI